TSPNGVREHLRVRRPRVTEIQTLEQKVNAVANLGRSERLPSRHPARCLSRAQASDPLRVVAVRTRLVEREGAVGEPAHPVKWRPGQRLEGGQLRRADAWGGG